jgi:chromosomal replication initiation ATPase DnaA
MQKKIIGRLENLALYEQAIIDLQIRVGELETALLQAKKKDKSKNAKIAKIRIVKFERSDLSKEFIRAGAEFINVPAEILISKKRIREIVIMRHCIAYLLKTKHEYSYQHIAKTLNRTHTTIMNSVRVFSDLLFTKHDLALRYFKFLTGGGNGEY